MKKTIWKYKTLLLVFTVLTVTIVTCKKADSGGENLLSFDSEIQINSVGSFDEITIKFRPNLQTMNQYDILEYSIFVDGSKVLTASTQLHSYEIGSYSNDVTKVIGNIDPGTHTIAVILDPDNKIKEKIKPEYWCYESAEFEIL